MRGPTFVECDRPGFVHEGTAREVQFADGEHVDVERHGPGTVLDG